jgi:isoprenylcysteine carboxyl methyltransferase (ICMT) family protein YpbQ
MYYLLILAVGVERLIELFVAKRNARWALSQGGKEFGHNHYPVMVTLHIALLLGCVIEVWGLHRPFIGWLGWPMLAVAAATAIVFTLANWLLLRVRIRVENAALGYTHDAPATATRSGADDI